MVKEVESWKIKSTSSRDVLNELSRKLSLGSWGVMTEDAAGLLMTKGPRSQGRDDYVMKLLAQEPGSFNSIH